MHFVPLHPRVKLEGSAAIFLGKIGKPVEHPLGVAFRAGTFAGHEIVHVQEFAVGQKLDDSEPRYASHLPRLDDRRHPVSRMPQAFFSTQVLAFD